MTLSTLRYTLRRWLSWPELEFKFYLVYTNWVFMDLFSRFLLMVIVTSFWRAVYENTTTISGLSLEQTVSYILLANLFGGIVFNSVIFDLGFMIRQGDIIQEMLRPVDFQWTFFIRQFSRNVIGLFVSLPLTLIAVIFFKLQLPSDPMVWFTFLVALILGQAVIFLFDWMLACAVFYTNEAWGLAVMRESIALFLSGLLVPYAMMPDWLKALATATPFKQAGAVPVSILSGATAMAEIPGIWATQLLWVLGLLVASRAVFNFTSRKITVQGG